MTSYSVVAFLSIFLSITSALGGYTKSRCETAECLCKVHSTSTGYFPVVENSRRMSLFYKEGEYKLSSDQQNSLERFLMGQRIESSYKVVAYTDGCGLPLHNITLGSLRAREVIDKINTLVKGNKIITTTQEYPDHNSSYRRVDITIPSSDILTRRIEENPADFYLVDASGSMSIEKWKKIISALKKPDAQVWVTKMINCHSGQRLEKIKPEGGTEIWWAYWYILDKMSPGQTLMIVSDFRSNFPLSISESNRISEKVKKKGVRVIYIKA